MLGGLNSMGGLDMAADDGRMSLVTALAGKRDTSEPSRWLIAIPDKGRNPRGPAKARIAVSHTLRALCIPGRTPRVSSGPEWAARESTHPAHGSPCATGRPCQRGSRASGGRVVIATPRRLESLPPGCAGVGVLCSRLTAGMQFRGGGLPRAPETATQSIPRARRESVGITLARAMEKLKA